MIQVFKLASAKIKLSNRCGVCLILLLSLQLNCLSEKHLNNTINSNTTITPTGIHQQLVSYSQTNSANQSASPSTRRPTRKKNLHQRKKRIKPREQPKTPSPLGSALSDELNKDATLDLLSSQYGDDNEYLDDSLFESLEDLQADQPTFVADSSIRTSPSRKEDDIEHIVRSQIDYAASDWVTLRPEGYPQGPSFNESIHGLDWTSYLTNYSKPHPDFPNINSRSGVSSNRDLFYPNHNYKFDNNYTNPFKPYVSTNSFDLTKSETRYLSTLDPITAASEESNRYIQVPSTTELVMASTPEPQQDMNQTGSNPMQYKYSIRNLPPKSSPRNATGRPKWYNPNSDLTRLIFRNHSSESLHRQQPAPVESLNTSEPMKKELIADKSSFDSKFRLAEAETYNKNEPALNKLSLHKPTPEDFNIKTSYSTSANSTGNTLETGGFEDPGKGYQLRPTVIASGPPQPPWLLRNHFSSLENDGQIRDKTTNYHLKSPNDYFSNFKSSSSPSSPHVTTVVVPTSSAQTFTLPPSPIPLPTSTGSIPKLSNSNSAASMRAIRARLGRIPSHHHHHHSHVHSIRPALISLPGRPRFRDYEGLVAAAAAAAASATATATRNQQGTYYHRQQVLARPLFSSITSHPIPSTYSYRLNIGTPGSHIAPIFVRHPPVSIPIGGSLTSMNSVYQHKNKPPLQSIQATVSATYHKSLLGHILDSANRAVKQVAGNTANLLNIHPPPALGDTFFHGGKVYSAKNNRDTNQGLGDLFESTHNFAAVSSKSYLNSMGTDGKELTPIGIKVATHPTLPITSLHVPNHIEESQSQFENSKEQVIFAPLPENGNLLYPILSSQLEPNPIASLIEEPEEDSFTPIEQTSANKYNQAPLWATEVDTKNKRIPLNKHYNGTSLSPSGRPYSKQVFPHHRRRPSQTILIEEKRGVHRNKSYLPYSDEPPMRYAVAHYIGETEPTLNTPQKSTSVQSGKKLVYELVDHNKVSSQDTQVQAPPIEFIPIKDSEASQSSMRVNKLSQKDEPVGQVYANLDGQTFILSNVDKEKILAGSPIQLAGVQDQEAAAAIIAAASMSDDYRQGSDSKGEQHLIQFTTTGSLYPHTDPLHQAIQAAASSIKPHLNAASDMINYHKLRLINHYLQYHMNDALDFGLPSNSARLGSNGGHRAHLLLHYWPIVLALLPIMIIVSIMVQLVLAAPLVLFAMTTLTAARFVGAIFGPLFGREELGHMDLLSASTKSAVEPSPLNLQQTNLQSNASSSSTTDTARISNSNFIQSIIKLHNNANFGPTKVARVARPVSMPTATNGLSGSGKTIARRRRKKRHTQLYQQQQQQSSDSNFLIELEGYINSLDLV